MRGGDLISDLISFLEKHQLTHGEFTHVGMAVTSDILPSYNGYILEQNEIYLMESTFSYFPDITHAVPDITTGQGKFGVQIKKLKDVIKNYIYNDKTKVAWCALINNPFDDVEQRPILQQQFVTFFNDYHERLYDMDPIDLLGSMFPSLRQVRDGIDYIINKLWLKCHQLPHHSPALWQFCSELVANVYQTIGIIPKEIDCKDVLPMDFFGYDEDGLISLVKKPVYIKY
jgi:hypothetical protein